MTTEYNQQLKQLFRSNTIVNIKLGISLALGQGYSWNYIAEKCLEEWLVFTCVSDRTYMYCFSPSEYRHNRTQGKCCFCFDMKNEHFTNWVQWLHNINNNWIGKELTSTSLEEIKQPVINRMEEFLKLIYNNEHDL